jgi:hypothetical protein
VSSDLNDFLGQAERLGFIPISRDGNGHIRLENRAGQRYSAVSTPSDHRSRRNDLSDLERLSGRRLPRQKSGKYRHRRERVTRFEKTPAELAAAVEVDELVTEAEGLRIRFSRLPHTRGAIAEAREVIERFEAIRDQLAYRYYRVIPSLDAVSY